MKEKWVVLEICLENYTVELLRGGKYFDEEILYFDSYILAEQYANNNAYSGYAYKFINVME